MNRTKEGFDPTQKRWGHYPACPEFDVRPSWCICDRLEQVMDAARADEREILTRWKAEATEVLREWDRVWEALGSPGRLGERKASAVLAIIDGSSHDAT